MTAPARRRRVPAFVPVPLRSRANGWTPWRQAAFLVALARSRSVQAAARSVGMARETAYRLRRRDGAESFAAAWDRVTVRAAAGWRKVTHGALGLRAKGGLIRPVVHRGVLVALEARSCNRSLLRLLGRFDRLCRGVDPGWGGGGGLMVLRQLGGALRASFDRLRTSGV